MQIIYSPKFNRLHKKLPQNIIRKFETKEALFRKDPFAPTLRTHKLHGILAGLYAFSIDQAYRVIFEFDPNQQDTILFHSIGDHDIYD